MVPYVVVHASASVPARAPSAGKVAAVAAALAAAGYRLVVTGSTAESALTAAVCRAAAAGPGPATPVDLGGRTSLPMLAAVLAGADVVVAPNTGAAHLAAAVGTPVVSLFAPVVPAARWAPYGDTPRSCSAARTLPARAAGRASVPSPATRAST